MNAFMKIMLLALAGVIHVGFAHDGCQDSADTEMSQGIDQQTEPMDDAAEEARLDELLADLDQEEKQ